MRNGNQMKKNQTVQWTASEWQLRPRLAWTSGPREHGVDDACETAKPQQDSSPRGGPKRSRMRRQGVPNPPFEPVKNTRTWASAGMLHPTFKPYTDTLTAPSAALPKRRNTKVCLTRPSNRGETLAPEPRQRMRNGTQMKKNQTVQWTASEEWQLRPRLAWTSGPREHGVDDACETAKPQQDSSPRGGPKRSRMRRQGVPNPTFEPVKKTL